jgi:Glycosyltransferase like family
MIAFGCSITDPGLYERYAKVGIRRAAEERSVVFAEAAPRSIVRTSNLILDEAAALGDLEALVLVHQEAEILDADFCRKVRDALRDPDVAVVGCAGAIGVRSIAWWEGTVTWASSMYRSDELGTKFTDWISDGWERNGGPVPQRTGEVDTVDGVVLVLSPWAVRNVRFDESLGPQYGFDFDFCLQVRTAGRKVATADLRVAHPFPLGVVREPETWMEAHMKAAEKWDGRMPNGVVVESDWRRRARRAEGEAAAARLLSATKMYEIQALAWDQERQLEAATSSLSWRVTKPLRKLGALRASGLLRRRR